MIINETEETFTVKIERLKHLCFGIVDIETWYNQKGIQFRSGDRPSQIIYKADTGRVLMREWTDIHGRWAMRPNGGPAVIRSDDDDPYMLWPHENGGQKWVAEPSKRIDDPIIGEPRFIYENPPYPVLSKYAKDKPPEIGNF